MIHQKINLWEGRGDVTLTTYVLDDSPELLCGKKRPAVLVLPGGAYLNCSDREGEPVALRFMAMGYHAFVLRYSVYSENRRDMSFPKPGEPIPAKPWLNHPAPMRDIARAFLEIRAHADEWLVDAERIAICGFSAGAHNCAMYSVYWDQPVMREPFGVDASLLRPAACILGYTLSDYLAQEDDADGQNYFAQQLFELCNFAFTGEKRPGRATMEAVSPARLVSKATPPTFLWSTFEDSLVPVRQSTLMANALAGAGVPFEIHIFESGEHGLALADQSTAADRTQLNPAAAQWILLCETWLHKRFALDLPGKFGL